MYFPINEEPELCKVFHLLPTLQKRLIRHLSSILSAGGKAHSLYSHKLCKSLEQTKKNTKVSFTGGGLSDTFKPRSN